MDKQTGKFIARIAENLPEMSGATMQEWIDDPRSLQKFLSGLKLKSAKATLVQKVSDDTNLFDLSGDSQLDFMVQIDRLSARVSYPRGKKRLMNPELEFLGPKEYNLRDDLEPWFHFNQQKGVVPGHEVYERLKKDGLLIRCIGLADLIAIQSKGNEVHQKLYREMAVFGWKSVIEDRQGRKYAPFLLWSGEMLVVDWRLLDHSWGTGSPAFLFKK